MFSSVNWNNLSDSEKCKHTQFPSNSNVYRNARMENHIHVAEAVKRKLKKKREAFLESYYE